MFLERRWQKEDYEECAEYAEYAEYVEYNEYAEYAEIKSMISESESSINSRTCLGHLVLFTYGWMDKFTGGYWCS